MNSLFEQQAMDVDADRTLSRIKTLIQSKRGLLDEGALAQYDRMKMLDSHDYRAALADKLVDSLSARMQESWPILYESLKLIRDYEIYKQPEWLAGSNLEPFPDFESYFIRRMGKPFDLFLEMEETYHFVENYHPKWKDRPFSEALKDTRAEQAERHRSEAVRLRADGMTQSEIATKLGLSRTAVQWMLAKSESNVNETLSGNVSLTSPIRETKPQIAAKNGVSRRHQHFLDKIAKYPDLQQSVDAGNLSVAKAYDIAMEREGKPRDRVSPILRMFDKLSHEEQIRTGRAIITKLGWGEEYNHGS